jgi:hypothetical protein
VSDQESSVLDNTDQLNGIAGLVERMLGRAGSHSRLWVAVWLAAILTVTVVAAISHAPTAAYGILAIVAGGALCADGRGKGS